MQTSSHNDAEEHLEEHAEGLARGECQWHDRQEGGADTQEDRGANFLHGQFCSSCSAQSRALEAEVVGHVHAVVHDKAHGHDQVGHRDAVQVQAPKDNVAHQVGEDESEDHEYNQHGQRMCQNECTDHRHSQQAKPNAGRHLLHDNAVLVKVDVCLSRHKTPGGSRLPLRCQSLRLFEHGHLLLAVHRVHVRDMKPHHLHSLITPYNIAPEARRHGVIQEVEQG
mmetsp:Transcript_42520/g.101342  ORF Transcript_42520/g.101342 Transcript_42520/m.101342 type:complete len:224 (+) Transcript_42520:251-922(+)